MENRYFVTVSKGESALDCEPVLVTQDPKVVKAVAAAISRTLDTGAEAGSWFSSLAGWEGDEDPTGKN